MKKPLFISLLLLTVLAGFSQKATKLQIIYFHSEHRCPTCISIEDNTKKALNTYFAEQLKNGTITLQVLSLEDKKNQKLVEKYEADGSKLLLTYMVGKKETTSDFTNFAFSYSHIQAEKFIAGLKAEIEKDLK